MPPRIPSYRRRWGSDFSFEPEDVYEEKENERTRQLISTAQRQRYGTDRPGFFGPLVRAPLQQAAAQVAERRAASVSAGPPPIPTAQPEKGGGGFFGKVKKIGGKALDVLDVGAETTFDIVRTPINPVSGAVNLGVAAAGFGRDIVAGRGPGEALSRAGSSLAHGATGGGLPQNIVAARGSPGGVARRQLSDFRARPIEEQLAVGSIFDPTNIIGAGALTTGLKSGARGAKTARSASLMNRLARVNKAADVAQAKFAPEIAGTIAGTIGATAMGEDPLKGAAVGLGVGAGLHGAAKLAGRSLATRAIPGSVIENVGDAGDDAARLAPETPKLSQSAQKRGVKAAAQPEAVPAAAAVPPSAAAPPPRDVTPAAAAPEVPARRDLFDLPSLDESVRAAEARTSTRLGKVGQTVSEMRRPGDVSVDALRDRIRRSSHVINDFIPEETEAAFRRIDRSGLKFVPDELGRRHVLEGTDLTLPDLVEAATPQAAAVRASLSEEQLAALDRLRWVNDYVNDTRAAYGLEPHMVETGTGDWFPRRVVAKDVESGRIAKDTFAAGRGRSVQGNRQGSRTFGLEAEGAAEGFVYADPKTAFEAGMRSKLLEAQDAMIAEIVQPLAVEGTSGFGVRRLKESHPALEKGRYVGGETRQVTPRGATEPITERTVMLGREAPLFPSDIADQLDAALKSNQPGLGGRVAQAINRYTIPLRASADLSQRFNQGIGFITSSPRNAAKAIRSVPEVVRSASGNPARYDELLQPEYQRIASALTEAGAKETDARLYAAQRGLHLATGAHTDEFLFPEGKIFKPIDRVISWSNDTFARAGNFDRTVLFADNLERAVKKGLKGEELARHMDDATRSLNRYGGWTGTKTSSFENSFMFAPRYFRSQVEQIAAALTRGDIEGQLARKHLGSLFVSGAVLVAGVNELRGYDTDYDPRSYNFMRVRNVFGHDISPYGPFATLLRAAAQTTAGDPFSGERGFLGGDTPGAKFARAKAAPWASTAWSIFTGSTFDDRPLTGDVVNKPKEALESVADVGLETLPFSVQAFRDAGGVSTDPGDVARGLGATAISGLGIQGAEVTPAEKRDFARADVAQEMFERNYDDLSGAEKAEVNRDPRVSGHQEEADRRGLERQDSRTEIGVEFRDKMVASARFLESGEDDAGNFYSGEQYRRDQHDANIERKARYEELGEDAGGGDDVVDGYFALYDLAEMENGQPDYDMFEDLAAAYATEHADVYDRIDKVTGVRDDPTLARFREAQKQSREYWEIPPVRNMSLEDGHRANAILAQAAARVTAGAAPNRRAALAQLADDGMIAEEEVAMALQASRLGSNPERKAFRVANPEFAIFYGSAAGITAEDLQFPVSQSAQRRSSGGSSGGTLRRSSRRTRNGLRR